MGSRPTSINSIRSFCGMGSLVRSSDPYDSQPQIVIHRHGNLLIGPKVALRRLDGRVSEQKLNLFQIAAALAAQLGTSPPNMPHAACSALCRIPDHAESLDLSCAGTPFGPLAMRHNPNA